MRCRRQPIGIIPSWSICLGCGRWAPEQALASGKVQIAGDRALADLPALAHLHECEYSATGYFGNEGSEVDFYIYGALHVEIPPYGEGLRVVGQVESPRVPASAPRKRSVRKDRG